MGLGSLPQLAFVIELLAQKRLASRGEASLLCIMLKDDSANTEPTASKPIVLVSGDVLLAWDIVHPTGKPNQEVSYDASESIKVHRQSAGAWHMTRILEAMQGSGELPPKDDLSIHGINVPEHTANVASDYHRLVHSYTVWAKFPKERDKHDEKNKVVRIHSYLGTQIPPKDERGFFKAGMGPDQEWFPKYPEPDCGRVRLIVLTDEDMGYRNLGRRPDLLTGAMADCQRGDSPWIVWKPRRFRPEYDMIWALSSSKEQADSQRNNAEQLHDKAIAILSADVLRSSNSRIGQGLSWDTLAQQTYKAVCEISAFEHFRWVIISFATVGALVVSRPGSASKRSAFLIFDPTELEGSWIAKHPGDMLGLTTCLVSTTARSLIKLAVAPPATVDDNSLTDALITGIRDGLICMRALYRGGYYTDNAHADPNREPRKFDDDDINQTTKWLTSSIKEACSASGLKIDNLPFAKVIVEYPDSKSSWNILASVPQPVSHSGSIAPSGAQTAFEIAKAIITQGPSKALRWVPVANYGRMITADPREIEGLRAVSTLFGNYARHPTDNPLSVAVFGPPGAGKSFGINEVAKQLKQGIRQEPLVFNLSQFSDPAMLIGALHQVRDVALGGEIPLVFWDEFDSPLHGQARGWLRYFLAPMQDGKFLDGQITHPTGRAIFVFAGGTSFCMQDFFPMNGAAKLQDDQKQAKLPDFVSRLRGFLNVHGLNPVKPEEPIPYVRRAILIHSLLKRHASNLANEDGINVEASLLNALLEAKEYKHGARSIEAIIQMSSLRGIREFTSSCLPNDRQLALHVEGLLPG